jgi:hypothetical protein
LLTQRREGLREAFQNKEAPCPPENPARETNAFEFGKDVWEAWIAREADKGDRITLISSGR